MTDKGLKAANALLAMQRHPWEQGFAAQAFYEAGRNDIWLPMARECAFRAAPDGRLSLMSDSNGVCDPASAGEVCLRAWEKTGDRYFRRAADNMLAYINTMAPKTKEGYVYHTLNRKQLWSDSGYMLPPFLHAMGDTAQAYRQYEGYDRYLKDSATGLYTHIFDFENSAACDRRIWATGNAWILMGLLRIGSGNTEVLLDNMLGYLRTDGLFHDVLNDPTSFTDGTTALMTAYVIFRGVREGTLSAKYLDKAEKAYTVNADSMDYLGIIHGVCGAPRFNEQGTSAEAQAAFILADSEREKVRS